jgi:hypothetical protein
MFESSYEMKRFLVGRTVGWMIGWLVGSRRLILESFERRWVVKVAN